MEKIKKQGRPTKYKRTFDKDVYKLCLLNATNKQIANFFEVNEDTIYEWKNKHKSFSESLRAGKDAADTDVAHSLYKKWFESCRKRQTFRNAHVAQQQRRRSQKPEVEGATPSVGTNFKYQGRCRFPRPVS